MSESVRSDVTGILADWRSGDRDALDRLIPLVYAELHRLAHAHMARERAGNTLQTTALVHETYLRLSGGTQASLKDRAHFFAVCARVMRRVLVDHARAQHASKRGGASRPVPLEEWLTAGPPTDEQVLAVDEVLDRLAASDHRRSQVVELRYFGGMTVEETAAVLGVSAETVARDWKVARMWLFHELRSDSRGQQRGH